MEVSSAWVLLSFSPFPVRHPVLYTHNFISLDVDEADGRGKTPPQFVACDDHNFAKFSIDRGATPMKTANDGSTSPVWRSIQLYDET